MNTISSIFFSFYTSLPQVCIIKEKHTCLWFDNDVFDYTCQFLKIFLILKEHSVRLITSWYLELTKALYCIFLGVGVFVIPWLAHRLAPIVPTLLFPPSPHPPHPALLMKVSISETGTVCIPLVSRKYEPSVSLLALNGAGHGQSMSTNLFRYPLKERCINHYFDRRNLYSYYLKRWQSKWGTPFDRQWFILFFFVSYTEKSKPE